MELAYPTAEMAGAALFHSVALNHGFHNGNKRTALVALIAFLDANGLVLTCTQEELLYHGAEVDTFISEYRHILTRLARL